MEAKTCYTDSEIKEILSANLQITRFGLVLLESDYDKYIRGREESLSKSEAAKPILNDYILVKHTGKVRFIHYGPGGLTEIKPSIDNEGSLSFGSGIYCFNDETHNVSPTTKTTVYVGAFDGDYLECVYDCDSSVAYDKGEGNTKEYLLLTTEPIPVQPYHLGGNK